MIVRACPQLQELKYRITGVAVLDIVEGALSPHMPVYSSRTYILDVITLLPLFFA